MMVFLVWILGKSQFRNQPNEQSVTTGSRMMMMKLFLVGLCEQDLTNNKNKIYHCFFPRYNPVSIFPSPLPSIRPSIYFSQMISLDHIFLVVVLFFFLLEWCWTIFELFGQVQSIFFSSTLLNFISFQFLFHFHFHSNLPLNCSFLFTSKLFLISVCRYWSKLAGVFVSVSDSNVVDCQNQMNDDDSLYLRC